MQSALKPNSKSSSRQDGSPDYLHDLPTIDSAIKTYMSWIAARTLTMSEEDTRCRASNMECLVFARMLLKAINGYTFPIQTSSRQQNEEAEVVAMIWNDVISFKQKPSKVLGRLSLIHAWDGVKEEIVFPAEKLDQARAFVEEFGHLLKGYSTPAPSVDSDAHLIWDEAGAELERRRLRRQQRAEEARNQQAEEETKESMASVPEGLDED